MFIGKQKSIPLTTRWRTSRNSNWHIISSKATCMSHDMTISDIFDNVASGGRIQGEEALCLFESPTLTLEH